MPPGLGPRPFTTSEALGYGLPRSGLRRADLEHPTRGVHALTQPSTLVERASGYALGMSAVVAFSHVTAARLLQIPLPGWLETASTLDVMGLTAVTRVRRAGCIGHRGLESREVIDLAGLRVIGLADTWCDLGEIVRRGISRDDLVVAADAVVKQIDDVSIAAGRHPHPDRIGDITAVVAQSPGVTALRMALARRVRPRGKRLLSAALDLARPGVRSPMETRSRIRFVEAGFPEPHVNHVVRDRAGEWLLEGDLVWPERRVIGEYQGAVHSDRARRSADASRRELAGDEDHRVFEIFAEDVSPGARRRNLLRRVARALEIDPDDLMIA